MMADLLVVAAALGPAAAAAVWLLASPIPWLRRVLGGLVAGGAVAAAWAVFWQAYGGSPPVWRGLAPSLLGSTVAAFVATGALLVLPRAEALRPRGAVPAVVGLGVATTAAVCLAWTDSLVAAGVLVPIPTMAAAAAALPGVRRGEAAGLVGLAAADALALAGLAWLVIDGGSTLVSPVGMRPGTALLLAAGAVKAGAVPWLGTWRMAAAAGAGTPVTVALRGQGVTLLVLVAVVLGHPGEVLAPVVWAGGALVVAAGAAALWARTPDGVAAAVAGTGAALLLVPVGLGGSVGVRALLLLVPAFLLAGATTTGLLGHAPHLPEASAGWRWIGGMALAVGAASLLGLPPFGGFPGTWMGLSLAWARGEAVTYLPAVGGVAVGIGLGALGAVGLARGTHPRPAAAATSVAVSAALVYMGAQPVRLASGWLLRVEAELGLPEVLATAGAPELPPVTGWELLWAGLPALVLVAAVLLLGRGLRDADRPFAPLLSLPRLQHPPWRRRALARMRAAATAARSVRAGIAAALLVELAVLAGVGWLVLRGIGLGFL